MNLRMTIYATLCAIIVAGPAAAGRLPETGRLLPADTLAVASVDSFSDLKSRFEKTQIYGLYKDPAMAAFVKDVKQDLVKSIEEEGILKQISSGDYPVPEGRVLVAAVSRPITAENKWPEPAVVLLCQWGKEFAKAKDLLEKEFKSAEAGGGSRKKEDYRGTQVYSFFRAADKDEEKDPKEAPEPDSVYCYIDDCFMFSSSADTLKFVIAHAGGSSGGTLAEDPDYQAQVKQLGAADIIAYVNVRKFIAMLSQADEKDARLFKAAGIDQVSGIAAAAKVAREPGSSLVIKGLIRTSGDKHGVLRILDMAAAPLKVPDFIASDSCSFSMANLDLAAAYDEAFRIANNMDPQVAAAMNSPVIPPTSDGQPGIELKKDVFAYLRPGFWSADVLKKGADAEQPQIRSIAAVAIGDREKLERSLSRIHERFFGKDQKLRRDFLGCTIYTLSFSEGGGPSPETDNMAAMTPPAKPAPSAFTVTDKYLLFGDVYLIEDAVHVLKDKTSSKLAVAKWFRKAAGSFPPAVGSAGMMDCGVYGQYFWGLLKTDGKSSSPASAVADELKDAADFSLLPEFSAVRKYFGIWTSQFSSVADGYSFEYRMLTAVEE
jgi:hypothetical protein